MAPLLAAYCTLCREMLFGGKDACWRSLQAIQSRGVL
jgi:hypothetical protein